MAIAGLVMMGLSAAVSAMGAMAQGNAQAGMAKYNEDVQQQNAETAKSVAATQAGQQQLQTRDQIAQQEAAYAGAGLDMNGTPLLVMQQTARQGALKSALTQWQGATAANADMNQAALDSYQGQQASTSSMLQAGTTLLTSASKMFSHTSGGGLNMGGGGTG